MEITVRSIKIIIISIILLFAWKLWANIPQTNDKIIINGMNNMNNKLDKPFVEICFLDENFIPLNNKICVVTDSQISLYRVKQKRKISFHRTIHYNRRKLLLVDTCTIGINNLDTIKEITTFNCTLKYHRFRNYYLVIHKGSESKIFYNPHTTYLCSDYPLINKAFNLISNRAKK